MTGLVDPAGACVARAHTSPGGNTAAAATGHPLPKVPREEFAGDDRALKQAGRRLVEDASETLRPVNVGKGAFKLVVEIFTSRHHSGRRLKNVLQRKSS